MQELYAELDQTFMLLLAMEQSLSETILEMCQSQRKSLRDGLRSSLPLQTAQRLLWDLMTPRSTFLMLQISQ